MKRFICLPFLLCLAEMGLGKDWHFSPYFGYDGQYSFIKTESESFHPVTGRFRVGSYIYKYVGIEGTYSTPLHTDNQIGIDVSIEKNYTFSLRLESDPKENQGLSAYFLLGYAVNEVLIENPAGFPGPETYKGANLGLGFKQTYYNRLGVYLEYNHQYQKDDVRIGGINLGIQLEF